jgi:hypothetical protein
MSNVSQENWNQGPHNYAHFWPPGVSEADHRDSTSGNMRRRDMCYCRNVIEEKNRNREFVVVKKYDPISSPIHLKMPNKIYVTALVDEHRYYVPNLRRKGSRNRAFEGAGGHRASLA